jgi:hypothetical protein
VCVCVYYKTETNRPATYVCVRACVFVCVRERVCVCACACACNWSCNTRTRTRTPRHIQTLTHRKRARERQEEENQESSTFFFRSHSYPLNFLQIRHLGSHHGKPRFYSHLPQVGVADS